MTYTPSAGVLCIALLPFAGLATSADKPRSGKPSSATTISGDRQAAIEQLIAIVNELSDLLANVRSKEAADAAAARIADIQQRIMEYNRQAITITPYTKTVHKTAQAKYGPLVNEAFRKLESEVSSLQRSDFYKSNELKKALTYGMSHPYFYNRRLDGTYINPPTAANPPPN